MPYQFSPGDKVQAEDGETGTVLTYLLDKGFQMGQQDMLVEDHLEWGVPVRWDDRTSRGVAFRAATGAPDGMELENRLTRF